MKRKKTFIHKVTFFQEDKKVYVYIRNIPLQKIFNSQLLNDYEYIGGLRNSM